MDTEAGTMCLDDIRLVRLAVNEILKLVRGGEGGKHHSPSPSAPTDQLLISSQISGLDFKLERILTLWKRNSAQTTTATTEPMETTESAGIHEALWSMKDQQYQAASDPSGTFATLLLSSLAVWLAVVILALLWMRLTDLRYRPSIVSSPC